jgi:hypothetical protein
MGLGRIPQERRSDLQLSGCHLVDCPHNGRKEVADKMIIVDAMQFAFTHPEGATLCFITGDVDYAYLLAVLQKPQWRTIVISKGTISSMLNVNCDMKMRWETDILQLRPDVSVSTQHTQEATSTLPENGSHNTGLSYSHAVVGVESGATSNTTRENDASGQVSRLTLTTGDTEKRLMPSTQAGRTKLLVQDSPLRLLSVDKEWMDDVELLRNVLKRASSPNLFEGMVVHSALKSLVGSMLKQTNPARFPNRESIRNFLAKAIDAGAVFENGLGATKVLNLPNNQNGPRKPTDGGVGDRRPTEHAHFVKCSTCITVSELNKMIPTANDRNVLYCENCYPWNENVERREAVTLVVSTLEMLAKNDDIVVAETVLCQQLMLRYNEKCTSKRLGELWIKEAARTKRLLSIERATQKILCVCKPRW